MNERRKHCRVSGAMVRETVVRIRPGWDGTLLNMCRGGALIEVTRPIVPGARVDIQFSFGDARVAVRALVVRCSVGAIEPLEGVRYHAALAFEAEMAGRADGALDGYQLPAGSDVSGRVTGSGLPGTPGAAGSSAQEAAK